MKWMSLNDLRESFLSYFESKGHLRLKSFSLVPSGDKSLLLINSGMAPLKKYFTGEETPPCKRITTCQKCIRTPDIDRVGKTARHGTYFEMLGNFSFGDYFKEEALPMAWEFLTKVLEIPADRLWPSIYEGDKEAFRIWTEKIGVPAERVIALGKEDNFWEHGPGPCGPCSEIYYDRGEQYGCGSPDCKPGCECDRYMEIWNNVFSQFCGDGKGNYEELKNKNIDTGMGLERLACVMQGVDNLFEVDTVRKILDHVCAISQKVYGAEEASDVSIRIITDHIRSSVMMISDGVLPSNEGRGYVLRRILRRALRHGKLLGVNRAFLCELAEDVIELSGGAYPELKEKREYIQKVIALEEERFEATIDSGLSILSGMIEKAQNAGLEVLSGEDAFKLYDTFGFPLDLTREIAEEKKLRVDEEKFAELMDMQRRRAREARGNHGGWSENSDDAMTGIPDTEFVGYDTLQNDASVLAVLVDGSSCASAESGPCTVVCDCTAFYAESGGQVGDRGLIVSPRGRFEVKDTRKVGKVFVHIGEITEGEIGVGDAVHCEVDAAYRKAVSRNHTAVHLLQAALRRVLGDHVAQSGSYVDSERARFDFSHFAAVSPDELKQVEDLVNAEILSNESVETLVTDVHTAQEMGAMALFGEKYGDRVRMVRIGDFSRELCGGTHLHSTAEAGLFKIISESSVAAGVRRIEAVTGTGVLNLIRSHERLIADCAAELKSNNPEDIAKRAAGLAAELKNARAEIDHLGEKMALMSLNGLEKDAETVGKFHFVCKVTHEITVDAVRTFLDHLKEKDAATVAVLSCQNGGKSNLVCVCGAEAVKNGANAGMIVKAATEIVGGGGGGRADSAVAGVRDVTRMSEAFDKVRSVLSAL